MMWMMGYNEAAHDNYTTRRLRPLVPRPPPPTSSSHRFHHHHHHHHLPAAGDEQINKREFNHPQQMVVVSSRWNPTPEQLQTLEELYRRGTRTPSAEEIQHITAQLRRYGKIEGKNVFYWFQNHKARERQKRRRQLDHHNNNNNNINPPPPVAAKQPAPFHLTSTHDHQPKDSSSAEVEETRNWALIPATIFTEEEELEKSSLMIERPRKTADQGWIHIEQQEEEEEEQQQRNDQLLLLQRRRKSFPATWNHLMQPLSSSSSCSPTNGDITLNINSTCTFSPKTSSSLVISSQRHDVESYETLELFPVNNNGREHREKCLVQTSDVSLNPRQFIEFLPLKK